jgi:hypothetical protein
VSHNNVTTWVCDTCGRREELLSGQSPMGWHNVAATPVVSAVPTSPTAWELCTGCFHELERLLAPKRDRVADLQKVAA